MHGVPDGQVRTRRDLAERIARPRHIDDARAMTNEIGPDLLDAAKGLQDATIELRRSIHADPEIGLQLP
ncbi:MAG: hypothetical protein HKN94_10285, partial [Acidimicrobiales bacterium]|nr:hypothetical protein [Acidimicrobiales bacterium]